MHQDELELSVAWLQHVGRSAPATRWYESVLARHRAPGRHYHDVRHVRWVVRHVTSFIAAGLVDDAGAVVAAGFFHDAVHDVGAVDNETASARLSTSALTEIGWSAERHAHVAAMIEATAEHVVPATDVDTDALLAADLAVLAAEPNRYSDYVRAVRREYADIDDDAWRTGRAAVLRTFLDREHLFSPHLGLEAWERRARANITAELADLVAD